MKINDQEIIEIDKILERFKISKTKEDVFYNVCFCILIPQSRFKTVLITVEWLKQKDFYSNKMTEAMLLDSEQFKARFKRRKVTYLSQMKQNFHNRHFYEILTSEMSPDDKRTWVKDNIKGLGWKTSSHLLRNLGYQDFAILDSHILKFLNYPKDGYLEIETKFRKLAKAQNLTLAQFDGILWKRAAKVTENEFIF